MSFNNFDIYLMIGIAVVATFMRLYDFPMPPLILAFVLGGLMEENLRRSLLLSDGSWTFLWDRTLTACILATTILIVGWQIYKTIIIVTDNIEAVRGLFHKNSQDPSLNNNDLLKFSSIKPPRTNAKISGGIGKSYNRINVATTAIPIIR